MTAASGADRVIAQTVDSAWRCDGCGERFTSLRVMGEHTCPASGADQPTLRDQLADPCGMRADGRPCPCCGDWPVTLPPGPCSCQPTHYDLLTEHVATLGIVSGSVDSSGQVVQAVCVNPMPFGAVCECGDYDGWEYEVCEGCGLPAPDGVQ